MAHVQKRQRGGEVRWVARFPTPDGGERSRTFDRKVDAERWLTEQEAARARGAWVDPQAGRISFDQWQRKWRETLTGRPSTQARKLGIVDNHLLPRFGTWPIADITTADVKVMLAEDLASGLSAASVRKHVVVLSQILQEAVAEGRLARNPCEAVKLPPEASREMRFLNPGQVVELALATSGHFRPLVWTAAYVGLRWGELAGMRIKKVDLLRRTMVVDEQLTEVAGALRFGPPKTKAGTRRVTIPGMLTEILGPHFASTPVKESGLAFPTTTGEPMRRSNFRRRKWIPALERLGWTDRHPLDGLTFHELRHTAAALAIAQGAHPLTIKERLGHSSITVTMDRYGHLFPAQDEALAESLDGVLRDSLQTHREKAAGVHDLGG